METWPKIKKTQNNNKNVSLKNVNLKIQKINKYSNCETY